MTRSKTFGQAANMPVGEVSEYETAAELVGYVRDNLDKRLDQNTLNHIVFIADWKNCLENNHKISNLRWFHTNFGPVSKELSNELVFIDAERKYNIASNHKEVLDFAIHIYSNLSLNDKLKLMSSIFSIMLTPQGDEIDIINLARVYKNYCYNEHGTLV